MRETLEARPISRHAGGAHHRCSAADGELLVSAPHDVVEGVALHRHAARHGSTGELGALHALGRGGAGLVVDLLLDDGAVHVVGAEESAIWATGIESMIQ